MLLDFGEEFEAGDESVELLFSKRDTLVARLLITLVQHENGFSEHHA